VETLLKRPDLVKDHKSKAWWVLLHEYEDYVRFLEAKIEELEATLSVFSKEKEG